MKKLRPYLPILILGAVLVLILGFVVFNLVRALGTRSRAVAEVDTLQESLQRVRRSDPTPTRGNINIVQENAARAGEDLTNLLERVTSHNLEPMDIEPAGFNRLLGEYREQWFANAYTNRVYVAEAMGYGFEQYIAGQLPRNDDLPTLTRQLQMTDVLLGVLFRNHVTMIEGFRRLRFEGVVESGEDGDGGGFRAPMMNFGGGAGANAGEPLIGRIKREEGTIHTAYPFDMTFVTQTESLRGVLNEFNRAPEMIVVKSVTVENIGADGSSGGAGFGASRGGAGTGMPGMGGMPGGGRMGGGMPDMGGGRFTAPGGGNPTGGVTVPHNREYRVVSGREKIRVNLSVEIVQFGVDEEEEENVDSGPDGAATGMPAFPGPGGPGMTPPPTMPGPGEAAETAAESGPDEPAEPTAADLAPPMDLAPPPPADDLPGGE